MAAQLPAPRVVIASNTDDGKSVVSSDTTIPLLSPFGPAGAAFSTLWLTSAVPASTTEDLLSKQAEPSIPRPPEKGTVFGTSDMPPGATSAFHRTKTLDYMVVLKGEIVLRLNHGAEVTIREGETMVQRGTIHSWINRTDQWCRMLFVMLDAEPIELKDGRVLGPVFMPHKPEGEN